MFWTQNEKGVDNTLMHFFAKSFYSKSRAFVFPHLSEEMQKKNPYKNQQKNLPKKWGSIDRRGDTNWPNRYPHTTEHHSQYINWGELPAGMANLGLGRKVWHWSAGDEQLYCTSMVCFLLGDGDWVSSWGDICLQLSLKPWQSFFGT